MNATRPSALGAFSALGIELEFMIVDSTSLSPLPIADRLLRSPTGEQYYELERGTLGWSNEMMLHVMEIKNLDPTLDIDLMPAAFQLEVRYINRMLELYGARLMPGAMHPWMNPSREAHLWPHQHAELYQAFADIFDCKTHGWANLQSMHINLPFADDEEFARLHAAIRLVLPILPALAASSPIADGRMTGYADFRMEAYRQNSASIPSVTGAVIPDTVTSRTDYQSKILEPIYRDIAESDPQRILTKEWLNARGAIARFDRQAIEIRIIDTQECVHADLAIAVAVQGLTRRLYEASARARDPDGGILAAQQAIDTDTLAGILQACIRDADQTVIEHADYLALLGFPYECCSAQELWSHLIEALQLPDRWHMPLHAILEHGPLARRIAHAVRMEAQQGDSTPISSVYAQLCDCLHRGHMFLPPARTAMA
jgi:glutamate---cysteine ligase / carboxylate-amine ligase